MEAARDSVLKKSAPADKVERMIRSLVDMRAIGSELATHLVREAADRAKAKKFVCLTEETVLLDEQDRIVAVSGYAVRPPQVRRENPRVSAFTSADIPKILAIEPDLVLTFSDLQAPIAA